MFSWKDIGAARHSSSSKYVASIMDGPRPRWCQLRQHLLPRCYDDTPRHHQTEDAAWPLRGNLPRYALWEIWWSEGWRGMFRSFGVTLLTNVPYGMVMLSTNECLRFVFLEYKRRTGGGRRHDHMVNRSSSILDTGALRTTRDVATPCGLSSRRTPPSFPHHHHEIHISPPGRARRRCGRRRWRCAY